MTDHQMIVDELKQQKELIRLQTNELSDIKKALVELAVQGKEIAHINGQINGLWRKYDEAFGPSGTISQIKSNQAACPGDDLRKSLAQQWTAIGIIAAVMAGVVLKALGVVG